MDRHRVQEWIRRQPPIQLAALGWGLVFLGIAVGAFIPGITTNITDMHWAGGDSPSYELGGQIGIAHSLLHFTFGFLGLAASRNLSAARLYLLAGGSFYTLLGIYGLTVGAEFLSSNTPDDVLHLVIGSSMVILGAITARTVARPVRA